MLGFNISNMWTARKSASIRASVQAGVYNIASQKSKIEGKKCNVIFH